MRQQDAVFGLFRIYSLPIRIHASTTNCILLKKLPDYLAVSADWSIYMELSAADVQLCRGERMLICAVLPAPMVYHGTSCAMSIFKDKPTSIMTNCQFNYQSNYTGRHAIALGKSFYFLTNQYDDH